MTDTVSGERSLTSACGNVTVTIRPGAPPVIDLADGAVRMFARDLADLVTATARSAAEAAWADLPEPPSEPSIDDAVAALTELRDGFRDNGYAATIDGYRAKTLDDQDRRSPQDERLTGPVRLDLPPVAMEILNASIDLLGRFSAAPPAGGPKDEVQRPVGTATSPSRLVTVESTMDHPVAAVTLSKRACEVGPQVLAQELTETAAAAAADLAQRENDYFTDLGLPLGPDGIAQAAEAAEVRGDRAVQDVTSIGERQADLTRRLYEGGYFA